MRWNVTGLDTLSWQNVAPAKTNRYWAHLVCAIMVISWSLYRMYREKVNFIDVRQRFLTSPEHRLKASAKTGTYFQAFTAAIVVPFELYKLSLQPPTLELCLINSMLMRERKY